MIRDVDSASQPAARGFLERHIESSMFLLGNLTMHGPRLAAHPNSGNFRLIEERGAVVAVFCLARRGNLLLQTGGRTDLAARILASCATEPIAIEGVIGEWNAAQAVWRLLCAEGKVQPLHAAQEVLYSLALQQNSPMPEDESRVRLLTDVDFEQWEPLNAAYTTEQSLPLQGSREERRALFTD